MQNIFVKFDNNGNEEQEGSKNWNVKEVALLKGLSELYKGHKYTTKEISKYLTGKTIYQVKYQRKKLNLVGERSSQEVTSLATEGGCDLVNSGNAHVEEVPRIQENINNVEFVREWRLLLENEIDKPTEVPPVLRAVYQRLMEIWVIHKWLNQALIERINSFICTSLYETILKKPKTIGTHGSDIPMHVASVATHDLEDKSNHVIVLSRSIKTVRIQVT